MDEHAPGDLDPEATLMGGHGGPAAGPPTLTLQFRAGSRAGTTLAWTRATCTMGRNADCDVGFQRGVDGFVSGRHLQLERRSDGWWLTDIGSTNGTFVNGRRIDSATRLSPGDAVDLGPPGQTGSAGFDVEFQGNSPAVAVDDTDPGSGVDGFEYRCSACGALCKAAMNAVGRPARCAACGVVRPVPLPSVNVFTAPRPNGPVARNPQPKAQESGKGLFSWVTDPLRNARERRELRAQIEANEGRLVGLRRATDSGAEGLGRAAWAARLQAALDSTPGERLQTLDEEREALRRGSAELDAELERNDVEEQAAAAEALLRIEPLRTEEESCRDQVERCAAELEVAQQALRGCLEPTLSELESLSRAALELAQVDDPTTLDDPLARLRSVTAPLGSLAARIDAGIEGVEEARARFTSAQADWAAARSRFELARAAHGDEVAAEEARVGEARRRRTELEGRRTEFGRRLQDLDSRQRPSFVALGRELAVAELGAPLEGHAAVLAALEQEHRVEQEMGSLKARLRDLGGD
jgi:hypothetical protein